MAERAQGASGEGGAVQTDAAIRPPAHRASRGNHRMTDDRQRDGPQDASGPNPMDASPHKLPGRVQGARTAAMVTLPVIGVGMFAFPRSRGDVPAVPCPARARLII